MADRVTCCPHCSTSFRISDAQLQTAKGAVRCGSCLQIFRALDHLLPQAGEQTQPAATEKPSPAPKESAEDQPENSPESSYNKTDSPTEQPAIEIEEPLANEESSTRDSAQLSANKSEEPVTSSNGATDFNDEESDEENSDELTQQDSIFTSDDEEEDFDINSTAYNSSLFSVESDGEDDESDDQDPDIDFDLEDDVLISDDMDRKDASDGFSLGQLSDDFLDTSGDDQQQSSLFDRKQKKPKNLETEISDESWAEELLEEMESEFADDDTEHKDAAETQYISEESDILKSFGDDFLDKPIAETQDLEDFEPEQPDPLFVPTPSLSNHDSGEYDRVSTGSFNTLDDETVDSELGESFSTRREPLFTVTGDQDSIDDELHSAPADANTQADETHFDSDRDNSSHDDHDLLLQGIAPAPVEMDWHVETSPWPKRLLWGSLSLLACLGLVAQLAYFNFEAYSRTQPWRQAYASLCPMLGCELPSLSDPRKVKAYNLVVRSNPDTQGALIIDSILLNTASFEQPFPDFALTFSNLQGKQVAYRRFTPHEYLGGELAGATSMPSGQPIHISLEVVDPGPDAVNYTATIPSH